jgi:hypothetical protein
MRVEGGDILWPLSKDGSFELDLEPGGEHIVIFRQT